MLAAPPPLLLLPALVLLSVDKLSNFITGRIARDERVVFFPTAASRINGTHWRVPIHGWIFEPELESKKRRVAIKGVGKLFSVKGEEEKKLLKRRLMPFTVDNQSMQYVNIKIGSNVYRMPRSSKDGHFVAELALGDDELMQHHKLHDNDAAGNAIRIVRYEAMGDEQNRTFEGTFHLIPPTGTSVITDIDDTIKITNYLDKKEFYRNTFLREFREVPGMKELFHKCAEDSGGSCSFHYVSASPFQLFEELDGFFGAVGFPPATYHLKRIRVKDKTLLQLFADPMEYKLQQIEPLMRAYPLRKFVLIGDSGEKDPEVYSELYRRHPHQVERIWIRNVNGANESRMDGVDSDIWRYFDDGYELLDQIQW